MTAERPTPFPGTARSNSKAEPWDHADQEWDEDHVPTTVASIPNSDTGASLTTIAVIEESGTLERSDRLV